MPKTVFFVSNIIPYVAALQPKNTNIESPAQTNAKPKRATPDGTLLATIKPIPTAIPLIPHAAQEAKTAHNEIITDQSDT